MKKLVGKHVFLKIWLNIKDSNSRIRWSIRWAFSKSKNVNGSDTLSLLCWIDTSVEFRIFRIFFLNVANFCDNGLCYEITKKRQFLATFLFPILHFHRNLTNLFFIILCKMDWLNKFISMKKSSLYKLSFFHVKWKIPRTTCFPTCYPIKTKNKLPGCFFILS